MVLVISLIHIINYKGTNNMFKHPLIWHQNNTHNHIQIDTQTGLQI